MRFCVIALVVVGMSSRVVGDTRLAPPGADARQELAGHVLVWHDAKLLLDPADPSTALQVAKLDQRVDELGAAMAMHVLASTEALVEVEPITGLDCSGSTLEISQVKGIHFFVARDDLAPLVVKRFDAGFSDGTRLSLLPGTPVMPTADGRYLVNIDGETIAIAIPAASIGHSYTPLPVRGDPFVESPGTTLWSFKRAATVTLGTSSWSTGKQSATTPHITRKGKITLLDLGRDCATATVATPSDQVVSFKVPVVHPPQFGALVGGDQPEADYLPAGTELTTPEGRPVATAASDITVAAPAAGVVQVCTDRDIYVEQVGVDQSVSTKAALHLCAPVTSLQHRAAVHAIR